VELHFDIDMKKVAVRNVSLVLGALALIHDGLDLALNGGADRFRLEPGDNWGYHVHILNPTGTINNVIDPDLKFLSELGRRLVEDKQWPSSAIDGAIFFSELLGRKRPERDIKLVTLKTGTLDGVIAALLDPIAHWFQRIFSSSTSVAKGEIGHEVRAAIEDVAKASHQPNEIKYAGIGLVIIGVTVLMTTYKAEEVSKVTVELRSTEQ